MPGGGGGDVTQETNPWEGQQPFLEDIYGEAQNLYRSDLPQYFPDPAYTPYGSSTLAGLDALQNRAFYGSPLESGAQQQAFNTLQGSYLGSNPATTLYGPQALGFDLYNNPIYSYLGDVASGGEVGGNPYLDATFGRAASRMGDIYSKSTAPSTLSAFSAAGAGRNAPAMREVQALQSRDLGDRLGDLATSIYGGAYESDQARRMQAAGLLGGAYNQAVGQQQQAIGGIGSLYDAERARQQQAIFGAPGLAQLDYANIQNLLGAGQALDAKSQEALEDAINRWNFSQQSPFNKLAQYSNIVQQSFPGGTTTQSQSVGGGDILGGIMGLGGLGLMAFGGPFGALAGAGLTAAAGSGRV